MSKFMLRTKWPAGGFANRRFIIVIAAFLVLSFVSLVNHQLSSFPAMTISLEEMHDPGSLEAVNHPTPPASQPETTTNTTRILLVSAMYPLKKSKHTHEEYAYWLSNFLRQITTDVYFFTTPEFANVVRAARGSEYPITIDTSYPSPFDTPPLKGLEGTYAAMHNLDREKRIHSPELYAVWNAKPFFLNLAVENLAKTGKVYDYAFWNDAGSFRNEHRYKTWPDPRRVDQIWANGSELAGRDKEDLLFIPITHLPARKMRSWREDMGPVDYEVSEGSFFGGSPKTITWWANVYYAYHDYYISLGMFVGKDQTLMNSIFFLFPDRFITVFYKDPDAPAHAGIIPGLDSGYLGACGNDWWYYQFWLSDRSTRDQMREIWLNWTSWGNWEWWRTRQRCRLTGVESMKDIFQKHFGPSWVPVKSTLGVASN